MYIRKYFLLHYLNIHFFFLIWKIVPFCRCILRKKKKRLYLNSRILKQRTSNQWIFFPVLSGRIIFIGNITNCVTVKISTDLYRIISMYIFLLCKIVFVTIPVVGLSTLRTLSVKFGVIKNKRSVVHIYQKGQQEVTW